MTPPRTTAAGALSRQRVTPGFAADIIATMLSSAKQVMKAVTLLKLLPKAPTKGFGQLTHLRDSYPAAMYQRYQNSRNRAGARRRGCKGYL